MNYYSKLMTIKIKYELIKHKKILCKIKEIKYVLIK